VSLPNDPPEKIGPVPLLRDPINTLTLAIVVLQILTAIAAFPFLSNTVPIHWDAAGQANRHASSWVNTILFPLLSIALCLLIRFATTVGPRPGGAQ